MWRAWRAGRLLSATWSIEDVRPLDWEAFGVVIHEVSERGVCAPPVPSPFTVVRRAGYTRFLHPAPYRA